jgi:carbamoyl-phosphate synthase large subunit
VIVQFGGQTPLRLAQGLQDAGVTILGTSVEAIDRAEDRGSFGEVLAKLGYQAPPYATATSFDGALEAGEEVGFPLLVRPSYVLGGRAMEIVYDRDGLADYLTREADTTSGKEIFLDRFLENAIEVDVDALCDGDDVWVGGIMQHVEEAGIHSGDSACVLPPHSLNREMIDRIRDWTRGIALELGVRGLINIQYAVHGGALYVIEANPRASRTVPFVSKAIGVPLAKMACRIMLGERIGDLDLPEDPFAGGHIAVKEAVMPFDRFVGSDALLGPEMRSTGEVMGVAADFPSAFAKAQAAAGSPLPSGGTAFISVTDADKPAAIAVAQLLHDQGFRLLGTRGTQEAITRMGLPCDPVAKLQDIEAGGTDAAGHRTAVSGIEAGEVAIVVNTPTGSGARTDGYEIRRAAITAGIPCLTTVSAGLAAARAIASGRGGPLPVVSLQELNQDPVGGAARGRE